MKKQTKLDLITPDWPAPSNVQAFSTTRNGGNSRGNNLGNNQGNFDSFNLALHVEDEAELVLQNRQLLVRQLQLPAEPLWLNQVHENQVINAAEITVTESATKTQKQTPTADAAYSLQANKVCAVMTADCLPVLICNRRGNKVAAAHAGWRGLAAGVIEATVAALNEPAENLLVWLGPAIGPASFEVGEDVRQAFIRSSARAANAFQQNRQGHYLADIYQLATIRLQQIGVEAVYGGEYCTFSDTDRFYSYRRDGKTGRQLSLIWFS